MAIPRLVEIRLRSKPLSDGTPTSGWSHKIWKNRFFHANAQAGQGAQALCCALPPLPSLQFRTRYPRMNQRFMGSEV